MRRMTARLPNVVHTPTDVTGAAWLRAEDDSGNLILGPSVAIVGLMHGNEPVGGPVLDRLLSEAPQRLRAGRILLVRANLEAEQVNERHTPEGTDLNRLWDRSTLERLGTRDAADLCYEERRALELAPLIASCDAILDLHSTSRPTAP